ncbi:MAG: hypothetical protein ACOY90_01425 [Candidatus Zhuqueibacterota bacterium]
MKFLTYLLLFFFLFVIGDRALSLAIKGQLFKPGAFKGILKDIGQQLWLGMRLFVILWLGYLIISWFIRNKI